MADLDSQRQRLHAHGQSHLLRCCDQLDPAGQAMLLEQIASIDLDQLDELIAKYVRGKSEFRLPEKTEPPEIVPAKGGGTAAAKQRESARERGRELIAAGKVAALVVAGGQGTRLGYEGPKGCLEVTPVTKKSLFQVFAEQILAASRRGGAVIAWYVMTSPANDVATRAFFRRSEFFGLNPEDVFFFMQGTMPAIDFDGRLILADKGQLALSPDGHGGTLPALAASGALADMARRGVELISYFQVDNPLARCVDPLLLGLHALTGAEMGTKCLPKRDPTERLGNFCLVDGRVTVIEYSDMPAELARATTADGRLRFSAGSIAMHTFSRSFIERITADGGHLPFHRATKKVPFIDAGGKLTVPAGPNAVKLEMFVFDALPLAKQTVILETMRSEEFSPIKNASGEDSLATCLHDQVRRAATWLASAGIAVGRDADGQIASPIEISPLFADSAQVLAEKVDRNLRIINGQPTYLGSRGRVGAK